MLARWVFEAEDDKHLVGQLARALRVGELPSEPHVLGGNDTEKIDIQLRQEWRRIVFVLDADHPPNGGVKSTWRRLQSAFSLHNHALPDELPPSGLVHSLHDGRSVAAWIFPDNVNDGAMEEFVTRYLLPDGDSLLAHARDVVAKLQANRDGQPRREPAARFSERSSEKAVVRSWLAWQKRPGLPPGLAIRESALRVDRDRIGVFAAWLGRALADEVTPTG